ncbi:transketolase [Candidatus Aerophobetes bacterium]|nr:transketolase [Candidatus Aerophobetes bacterium]
MEKEKRRICWGFEEESLDKEKIEELKKLSKTARGDILKMTTVAASGHPGGSMSSIDIYLTLWFCARVWPDNPHHPDRDRIVVSHGHTSPGVYVTLGHLGFFNLDDAIANFRRTGSMFEGHIERDIPGVEWSTGNLGQGLSAGCGFALAAKLMEKDFHTFVVMSDGEQSKGQVGEARRFAKKYNLTNLTVIIDYNLLQLSGPLKEIMPQNIKENYLADGWKVIEIDGHNHQEIYRALREAVRNKDFPVAILAHTIMGKGVSFMEDKFQYHGKPLSVEECKRALKELGVDENLEKYFNLRKTTKPPQIEFKEKTLPEIDISPGKYIVYEKGEKVANRSAFGKALQSIGEANKTKKGKTPIAVFDCDLLGSVKTDEFAKSCAEWFFEGGIQEHNTAAVAGALSTQGVIVFFSDFGVFGVDETYNQHRLNDLNRTNLKLVCTHNGIDVGQDGKTHQCIDYGGVINNLFGFEIIIPADANQTDKVIRYIATHPGNFFVGVGRSKLPVILSEDGLPFFGENYQFTYGKADIIREGNQATIISTGTLLHKAIQAWQVLKEKGYSVKVVNISCWSKLDAEVLREASKTGIVITYEDHNVKTGLGSIVANFLAENSLSCYFKKLGIKRYAGSGPAEELFKMERLDTDSLVNTVIEAIKKVT